MLNVPAYVIGGRILRSQVLRGISSALRGECEDALVSEDVPAWVRERVVEQTLWLGPVTYGKPSPAGVEPRRRVSGIGAGASPGRTRGAGGSDGSTWEVASELAEVVESGGIEEVARRIQEFLYDLEEEVSKRCPIFLRAIVQKRTLKIK